MSEPTSSPRYNMRPSHEPAAIVASRLAVHSPMEAETITILAELLGRSTRFEAGRLIAQMGDPTELVTIVRSGFLCRMNIFPDGRRQIHSLMIPGDAVDVEAPLVPTRPDSIEALSDCEVWLVPKDRLAAVLGARSDLVRALAREAAIASQVARQWVVNIGRRSALERIAHLICELYVRLGAVGMVESGAFALPLTQRDIADTQGLTPVHANRTLGALRRKELIRLEKQQWAILDWEGLSSLSLFDPLYLGFDPTVAGTDRQRRECVVAGRHSAPLS